MFADKQQNFPESVLLKQNSQVIKDELKMVMEASQALPKFHQVDKAYQKIFFDDGCMESGGIKNL